MVIKSPVSGSLWEDNLQKTIAVITGKNRFLFCAHPDPDSLGSMIALATYLKLIGKEACLILPNPFPANLFFMKEIMDHYDIQSIHAPQEISRVREEIECLFILDTANSQLLPDYETIRDHLLSQDLDIIETDHHFGNDSEELTENGIKLYRKANANTEIIAELLSRFPELGPEYPNPFEHRSILINLLTGLLCDTAGGRSIALKNDYDYWYSLLGGGLVNGTRWRRGGPDRPADNRESKFCCPEKLFKNIHRLTKEQEQCIETISEQICHEKGVGFLNLLDSTHPQFEQIARTQNSGWFVEVWASLLLRLTEKSGKVGMVCYQGKTPHGEGCFYIKMRRAENYMDLDLRTMEPDVRKLFDGHYLGGGGHPTAVSFRIRQHEEKEFLSRLESIPDHIRQQTS